jgi:8-oxo-dGTP diphosphatase
VKDSFCSYCGSEFPDSTKYPRNCVRCGTQTWSNPLPVVMVLLVIERQDGQRGLLIQRRNIEPQKGNWALTGGYIDNGETWQQAAVREVREELNLETDIERYKLFDVQSGKNNTTVLIVCKYTKALTEEDLQKFLPNEEVSEVSVMWDEGELAFPSHTDCSNRLLRELKGV